MDWARGVGRENGFVTFILRSDCTNKKGLLGKKIFVVLGCERNKIYKPRHGDLTRKGTGTRKCKCPFRLRGRPKVGGEGWKVNVVCGVHNHPLKETIVGHPLAGRLSRNEKTLLVDMTKKMVRLKDILLTMKEHDSSNVTTVKQIYNA